MKEHLKLIWILLTAKNPYLSSKQAHQVHGSLFADEVDTEQYTNWKWFRIKALICLLLGRTWIATNFSYTDKNGKGRDYEKYKWEGGFIVANWGWHIREMSSDTNWTEMSVTSRWQDWFVWVYPNGT